MVAAENTKIGSELCNEIQKAIDMLSQLKKDTFIHPVDCAQSMVEIYEKFNGMLDVTGHHAGTDMNAKVRVINGQPIR